MENHVILCGYGRVGQEISNQIKTQNIPIIVVESDEDRKKIAEENGLEVLCADATLDETLKLAGLEKDLVDKCREENFGIWTTLSSPIQVRIGILNQLNQNAIADIAGRFADAMLKMGASFNKEVVMQELAEYFSSRI